MVAMTGGILIFLGIILLGIAILALFGYFNIGMVLERKILLTFAVAMVVVGFLDTFAAMIIARW